MKLFIGLLFLCIASFAASITPTLSENSSASSRPRVYKWASVTSSDTSVAIAPGDAKNMSMQTSGTGTVILDGSNDCVTFSALRDSMTGVVSAASAGIVNVTTRTKCVRPRTTSGTIEVHLYISN